MRRLALAVLLLTCVAADAAVAHVRNVGAIDPRAFGYFVGDVIERTFEIDTDRGDEIVDASLPHAGPLTYWLELKSASVSSRALGDRARHTLKLAYQIFYVPVDPHKLEIPPVTISFKSGKAPTTCRYRPSCSSSRRCARYSRRKAARRSRPS